MIQHTATALLQLLTTGQVRAVEVARAFLDRIAVCDDRVGAFLRVERESALATAEGIDERRAAGDRLGGLAGLPIAVKDVLCTAGRTTSCGSRMLEHYVPPYDATVIARLKMADAVLIGKTNMDEFAMGSSTENSALGRTRNPWDLTRVPGGSSGGSAACVAADMSPLALGSDTGGSIRQPASFCGIVGLKPTYGRVSRFGLVAFASSLDQVGPFARTAEDAALVLSVIGGHDPRDSTSAAQTMPTLVPLARKPMQDVRLGVVKDHFGAGLDPNTESSVREAIDIFRSLGARIEEVEMPHQKYAIATYYIIAPCEASSNLARYDGAHYGYRTDEREMLRELAAERKRSVLTNENVPGRAKDSPRPDARDPPLDSPLVRMYRRTRAEGFGPEVKRRIMLGTYALSAGYYDAYYLKALRVRRLIRDDYHQALSRVDALIGPVTPSAAFRAGEKLDDPLAMYLGDLYTVGANLAGIPAISFPAGFTREGLPIGVQLQARPFAEQQLLECVAAYQAVTDWHQRRPHVA